MSRGPVSSYVQDRRWKSSLSNSIQEYEQQRTNHDTIKTGSATNSRPLRITNVTFGNGGKILLQSLGGVGRTAVRRSFDVSGQMIDDYSAQPRI